MAMLFLFVFNSIYVDVLLYCETNLFENRNFTHERHGKIIFTHGRISQKKIVRTKIESCLKY